MSATNTVRQAQSIVGTSPGRPEHDFYRTPPEATKALLAVESFIGPIWEPACGDGAICKVLDAAGFNYIASDLIDRGFGEGDRDFLDFTVAQAKELITNPPFILAEQFLTHAKHIGVHKIALLLKLAFLEGVKRGGMLEQSDLARVWVFKRRLNMTRNGEARRGSGMIAFAWFVWDEVHQGPPQIGWIDAKEFV